MERYHINKKFYFDDMLLIRYGKRKELKRNSDTRIVFVSKISVPIIVCIKTYNFYTEQAAELLECIISILKSKQKHYMVDLYNIIYSYAEFCSYILSLCQLRNPPPFSELIIPIANKSIKYYEGLLCDFPCEDDESISQLFSLLPTNIIISIWTALLIEKRIVIYTSNPNIYFYATKAIIDLLFPLEWLFSKGIISNAVFLTTPIPYCYGMLKCFIKKESEIYEIIDDDSIDCIILTLEKGFHKIEYFNTVEFEYPFKKEFKDKIDAYCNEYHIKFGKEILNNKVDRKYFTNRIQRVFFEELSNHLNSFGKDEIKTKKLSPKRSKKIGRASCRERVSSPG